MNGGLLKISLNGLLLAVLMILNVGDNHAADLDDVTMKVIGLDEIPGDSFHIEIPKSALENMADISEATGPRPAMPSGDALLTTPEPGGDSRAAPPQ